MKNNVIKIFISTVIIMILCFNIFSVYGFSVNDMAGNIQEKDLNSMKNITGKIITLIGTIASVISVVVLIVLGIKYMIGSVEEKAQYKKTLFPYIIGATLVFATSTIASLIYNLASHLGT